MTAAARRFFLSATLTFCWVAVQASPAAALDEPLVAGRVLAAESGQPIAGAIVWDPIDGASTTTDQQGDFSLVLATPALRFLRVTAPDRIQEQVPAMALAGRLQVDIAMATRGAETTVGSAGAVITSADGQVELTVPAGALALDASLGLTPLDRLARGSTGLWRASLRRVLATYRPTATG